MFKTRMGGTLGVKTALGAFCPALTANTCLTGKVKFRFLLNFAFEALTPAILMEEDRHA